MNKILVIGPYFGNIKQEIENFSPHAKWISENVSYDYSIVITHYNRKSLYPWADKIIPIDWIYTMDEKSQKEMFNLQINKAKFLEIQNKYIDNIKEEYKDCEIKHFNINYRAHFYPIPEEQKSYLNFKHLNNSNKKDYILYIPDNSDDEYIHREIFDELNDIYDIKILGDRQSCLLDENSLSLNEKYINKIYYNILKEMNECKLIICPNSHWTQLANQMKLNVFSWGKNKSLYVKNGIYNFNNKNCSILSTNNETNINIVINQIKWKGKNVKLKEKM